MFPSLFQEISEELSYFILNLFPSPNSDVLKPALLEQAYRDKIQQYQQEIKTLSEDVISLLGTEEDSAEPSMLRKQRQEIKSLFANLNRSLSLVVARVEAVEQLRRKGYYNVANRYLARFTVEQEEIDMATMQGKIEKDFTDLRQAIPLLKASDRGGLMLRNAHGRCLFIDPTHRGVLGIVDGSLWRRGKTLSQLIEVTLQQEKPVVLSSFTEARFLSDYFCIQSDGLVEIAPQSINIFKIPPITNSYVFKEEWEEEWQGFVIKGWQRFYVDFIVSCLIKMIGRSFEEVTKSGYRFLLTDLFEDFYHHCLCSGNSSTLQVFVDYCYECCSNGNYLAQFGEAAHEVRNRIFLIYAELSIWCRHPLISLISGENFTERRMARLSTALEDKSLLRAISVYAQVYKAVFSRPTNIFFEEIDLSNTLARDLVIFILRYRNCSNLIYSAASLEGFHFFAQQTETLLMPHAIYKTVAIGHELISATDHYWVDD